MATVIGDIAIQVGADIGPLVRELGKGSAAVSKFGADAQKGGAGMALATKAGIALGSAVVGAGVALASMTSAAMDNIDALSKQARIAGVSVATFQAMAQVAEEAGVSSEELSKSIVKMQDSISNAAKGTQAQVDAFAALGLSASNFAGLKTDEQFALLAEKISGIEDPVKRTSVALDIFGKSGAGLTDMMNGYGDAVANAAKFQSDFGLAVSDIDAQQIEAANDAMGRMGMAVDGLGTLLAVTFAPGIEAIANAMMSWVAGLLSAQSALDDLLGNADRARAILGEDVANALLESKGLVVAHAEEIKQLAYEYDAVVPVADLASSAIAGLVGELLAADQVDLAMKISDAGDEMDRLNDLWSRGKIGAEDYKTQMTATMEEAQRLLAEASQIDGIQTADAVSQIGLLARALEIAHGAAAALRSVLPGGASSGATTSSGVHTGENVYQSPLAPSTSPRPGQRPMDLGDYGSSGGGGGGGGGTDTTAADFKAMQDRFATESELLQAKYDADLAKLETFRQTKAGTEQEYNDLELQIKADHEQALADIEDKARSERFDAYSGAFGDLASLMASSNDKLFKIGQAASIGKAVVDGYEAAVSAWKQGMAIGGPGLATAFTAASLAKTGALIAGIASASPRGGGGQASGGGGAVASGGGSAGSSSSGDNATYLNFSFKGGLTSSEEMGRFMVAAINQAVDNGAVIRGARIA